MQSTTRPYRYGTTPRPASRRLAADPLATMINRAVEAHRIHRELGEPEAAAGYLAIARMLLEARLERIRQESAP